jgi:hypothetical protein
MTELFFKVVNVKYGFFAKEMPVKYLGNRNSNPVFFLAGWNWRYIYI